jgi:hypothetical protein
VPTVISKVRTERRYAVNYVVGLSGTCEATHQGPIQGGGRTPQHTPHTENGKVSTIVENETPPAHQQNTTIFQYTELSLTEIQKSAQPRYNIADLKF